MARKHILDDVCIQSLGKIYTLPNIEIQEAFFKLREQAKCHLQTGTDFATGLDVINNTNLLYFSTSQKAEFFTLKGIFLSKLHLAEEANASFASATQIDLNLAKAWAAWGRYNDALFLANADASQGAFAVNCYLHAAMLYNNGKSRKILARLLYLLSLDEGGALTKALDAYKGDIPLWYYITFIPQLLGGLHSAEAVFCRSVLLKLAKTFPQALHYHLRTVKEELAKRAATPSQEPSRPPSRLSSERPGTAGPGDAMETDPPAPGTAALAELPIGRPAEVVEEVMALLKTAFPLLALTLETVIDQIAQRLKPSTDEDIHRLIVLLLNDGVQMYTSQLCRDPSEVASLSPATEQNLLRFAASMSPNHLEYKADFERDFIHDKPNLYEMLMKFREWRDRLAARLDRQPQVLHLERVSHVLTEFEHLKFEDIEVPGQYELLRDSNKDFVKIQRFLPNIHILRNQSSACRRLTFGGVDGSESSFLVQHPAHRGCRREEKLLQLLRHFGR